MNIHLSLLGQTANNFSGGLPLLLVGDFNT
jgi:hypothetical protein